MRKTKNYLFFIAENGIIRPKLYEKRKKKYSCEWYGLIWLRFPFGWIKMLQEWYFNEEVRIPIKICVHRTVAGNKHFFFMDFAIFIGCNKQHLKSIEWNTKHQQHTKKNEENERKRKKMCNESSTFFEYANYTLKEIIMTVKVICFDKKWMWLNGFVLESTPQSSGLNSQKDEMICKTVKRRGKKMVVQS